MASLPSSITLHNRTALVTGGSRGIGKGIALELAHRGANVAIVYVNPAKASTADETVAEIRALGVQAVAIQADLKDATVYERIVKETLKGLETDKIHILVHNAGVANTDKTADIGLETFNDVVNTNIRAPFFLTQACLPYISQGGRIILISSISARIPNPAVTVTLYGMTKAANEALARDWAVEFGHSRGINVNAVAPGLVATDILNIMPDEFKVPLLKADEPLVAAAPRIGEPDDVAQVVAFLASEGARWITGSTVNASGGRYFF